MLDGHPRLDCQRHAVTNGKAVEDHVVLIIYPLGRCSDRSPIHTNRLKMSVTLHGVGAPDVLDQLRIDNGSVAAVVSANVVMELERQSITA